ncbi:phosphoribosyltransferase-like protein [Peziza echinospora]|nr:phosphoribosyltransferase-like protein [Peziza echinospora]
MSLPAHKSSFLTTCIDAGILRFGSFTLKSGRQSPYFFQAGSFNTASLLSSLATAYANTILGEIVAPLDGSPPVEFDVIFGPAYKGIPLAAITTVKLGELAPEGPLREKLGGVGYSFNRKEAKAHGEGGSIVGMELKGKRVLIIDDVITAGTAIRESVDLIRQLGGSVVGIIVSLDRRETIVGREEEGRSAVADVKLEVGCGVHTIITFDDLIKGVGNISEENRQAMVSYREKYGAKVV